MTTATSVRSATTTRSAPSRVPRMPEGVDRNLPAFTAPPFTRPARDPETLILDGVRFVPTEGVGAAFLVRAVVDAVGIAPNHPLRAAALGSADVAGMAPTAFGDDAEYAIATTGTGRHLALEIPGEDGAIVISLSTPVGMPALLCVTLESRAGQHGVLPDRTPRLVPPVSAQLLNRWTDLVQALRQEIPLGEGTPGIGEMWKPGDPLEWLPGVLAYEARLAPIILVTADATGRYLVDVDSLRTHCLGIAHVVAFPASFSTWNLKNVIDERFAPYRGAITVAFAPDAARPLAGLPCEMKRFIDQMLSSWTGRPGGVAASLRGWLASTAADYLTRERVRPATLRSAGVEAVIDRADTALREAAAVRARAEADMREAATEIARARAEAAAARAESEAAAAALAAAERRAALLEEELACAEALIVDAAAPLAMRAEVPRVASEASDKWTSAGAPDLSRQRQALALGMRETVTVREALDAVEALYPERLVVLPSARASADESAQFRYGRRAQALLLTLATEYWQALVAGGAGDSAARKCFGNDVFAARESDTVTSNRRARSLRTFEWDGVPVFMPRHLRIGVKDNLTDTLRIHFTWHAESRRIVIGHVGRHLDFG